MPAILYMSCSYSDGQLLSEQGETINPVKRPRPLLWISSLCSLLYLLLLPPPLSVLPSPRQLRFRLGSRYLQGVAACNGCFHLFQPGDGFCYKIQHIGLSMSMWSIYLHVRRASEDPLVDRRARFKYSTPIGFWGLWIRSFYIGAWRLSFEALAAPSRS